MQDARAEVPRRVAQPDRALPADLVPEDLAEAGPDRRHGVHHGLGELDAQPGLGHHLTQGEVVGQMLGQRREPAHAVEDVPAHHGGRAHGEAHAAGSGQQGLGQEPRVDAELLDGGPEAAGRGAAVEAGDQPRPGIAERGGAAPQQAGRHADVGIGEQEQAVLGQGVGVGDVVDLGVAADAAAGDHDLDVALRPVAAQALDNGQGRVVRVARREEDLEDRIVLVAEAGQVLVEPGLDALERLEYRDRRQVRGRRPAPAQQDGGGRRAGQGEEAREDGRGPGQPAEGRLAEQEGAQDEEEQQLPIHQTETDSRDFSCPEQAQLPCGEGDRPPR